MADNNGLLFYKKNYHQTSGKVRNSNQINTMIESSGISEIELPKFSNYFLLSTTYPGLLMGTGYTHQAKGVEDAYKIGFFFDHTTGMPIIPGSSLKGVLRSVFPQFDKKDIKKIEEVKTPKNASSIAKAKWISSLIAELKKDDFNSVVFIDTYYQPNEEFSDFKLIHQLELELFDIAKNIFYDVIPVRINGNNKGNESKLFADDYLTHHSDPLKNPDPLKFLKVLPKVVYQFSLKLHPCKIEPLLKAEKIELLFKKILLTIGIGAKTNVGYGQFTDAENPDTGEISLIDGQKKKELKEILDNYAEIEKNKTKAEKLFVKGAKVECTVIAKDKNYYTFGVDWDNELKFQKKIGNIKIELNPDDKVLIEIIDDYYIRHEVSFSNNITKV